ncbi:MAG TPA: nucleotide sugar dehydrogenase [Candidatus Eisenbacteria bacterium]|jgi:UDP-N-acetyl-D-glucosamine dehydrogenase|nr:nucleotide sugar dehydrogenase [Candidatus Eisenbacteria bacterium]
MSPKRRQSDPLASFIGRVDRRTAKIGVIGLGYVGLPVAAEFAKAGFRVTGFEIDARRTAILNSGKSYIQDVSTRDVRELVRSGHLKATLDFTELRSMDAIDICVPTPLRKTKDPDVSYIVAAVEQIVPRLRRGQLVVLESTTYPGTTDELMRPMLEMGGLRAGKDYFLAFSPERIDPGNPVYHTRNIPKVVGGHTPNCTRAVEVLYASIMDKVVTVTSTQVAETVKLLENTFRSVNIGLVNEMALMCDKLGIDVWEVIDAAATKPFGFMPFYPGPGLGGHCIPIDPFYLSWKARQTGFEARFIELAGQVNGAMPHHVTRRVSEALNSRRRAVRGARVLVLGVAYKADIDDVRESPSLDILETLEREGARISYSDPHVPSIRFGGRLLRSAPFRPSTLRNADCVVIATAHKDFDYRLVSRHARVVVDCRNALKGRRTRGVFRL